MQFCQFEMKNYVVAALKDLGFKTLTPIQQSVLRSVKENKNIIAMSKTGSGKTHSFLIPIFNALDELDKSTQAVIVAPTLELARQITSVAKHIASFSSEAISIKSYTGGTDMKREIERIETNPPQIVIATLGKLIDLTIDENQLKIHNAKFFVIDEADMIADSFLEETLTISAKFLDAKKMLFSATISEANMAIIQNFIPNTNIIDEIDNEVLKITHYLIPIKYREKDQVLDDLIHIINPYLAIIFVNKKEDCQHVYELLKQQGYETISIHGDLNVRERKRIVNEIRNLKYQYVVATDMVARGIDLEGVSHIINYSLPTDYEFYIHRSGRTGRMGMDGECYSLLSDVNYDYINLIKAKGIQFEYIDVKNGEIVKTKTHQSHRENYVDEALVQAKKMIKKPTKVKPNYKKKHEKEVRKLRNTIKYGSGRK